MYHVGYNPEIVLSDRYLIESTISDSPAMAAMVGYDQVAEEEVFIKSRSQKFDPNAAMRISREADVLDSLQHSQIPKLRDAVIDDQRPYIVTELKPSDSNVDKLFEHNVDPLFAAQLCISALKPLEHAHDKGFTHRDVKPANLIMKWAGDVALSDWELALCKNGKLARDTYKDARYSGLHVTEIGLTRGTPEYMSPEQSLGRHAVQDRRSDLYSLGVVLYKFLYDKLPLAGVSQNEITVRRMVAGVDYDGSSERWVPSDLQKVTERALQEKPYSRYQSAGEMREDLERWVHDSAPAIAEPIAA